MTADELLTKPEPISDAYTAFYWEGAAAGELRVQSCATCRHQQFPPNVLCEKCQSTDLTHVTSAGTGTLYAKTVMHQAFHPAFADSVPFTLCLVDLDDAPGVRILTNLVDAEPDEVQVGDAVHVVFEKRGGSVLPQFTPSTGGAA